MQRHLDKCKQAVSGAAATASDLPGRTLGHRGGLAPVPNDGERTQAGTRRAGSP
jgi:hypothetical protein